LTTLNDYANTFNLYSNKSIKSSLAEKAFLLHNIDVLFKNYFSQAKWAESHYVAAKFHSYSKAI